MTNYATLSDDDLMQLCRQGEDEAFRVVYERHKQAIAGFAYRMVRDRDAALDMVQEAFLYLFKKLPEYQPEGKLLVLLYRVVRSLCLNFLVKRRRGPTVALEDVEFAMSGPIEDPSQDMQLEEVRQRVGEAVRALPIMYSEVIIMRILQGLPYSEIAAIVGCPEGTVKSRLHNGLELLKKALAGGDSQ